MVVVNPQTVSDNLEYPGKLSSKEKTELKKNFGRLWEVMAAGNLIPPKSFQARTVNFEYLKTDKNELSSFGEWLGYILKVPAEFNTATLKCIVGKSTKITVNFVEKKDPSEARKQTPTQYQEKGTTDVFNRVLEENARYGSIEDMRKDKDLMDDLRGTFSGKTAKKNVGNHVDKIDDWMNTFFNQQDLFFMQKYAPSVWSPFEYHNQDWVHFFSKFIKKVKTNEGKPVGDYTTWNPSDIWAVYNKTEVNKAIDKAFKMDKDDPKLSTLNNLLITLMKESKLVGISLKKIEGGGAHIEEMNISPESMKLAEVVVLKMKDIDLELDNIVQQEKVTTYIKFAKTHTMNINLGDKKKPGNLSFNTQVKGTAAQGGQAPVAQVVKLLHAKGTSKEFINDHSKYPIVADNKQKTGFWDKSDDWEKKYDFVKRKSNSSSWPSWEDFKQYLTDFYRGKKPQLAMTKLMQIDFYYDALKNYTTPQEYADFYIALLHLGMKVGDRFAPHAKIS
jgi:hypothetical protein